MAVLANSDITFTPTAGRTRIIGRLRYVPGRMSIGNSVKTYPSGGITPLPSKFGMYTHIDSIAVQEPGAGGVLWSYSRTNDKLKAFTLVKEQPFLVVEELVAFNSSGVCDPLSYIPAYIIAIHDASGNLYDIVPSTITPLANEAKLVHSTGVMTLGGITVASTVKVTYIPADDTGLWSTGNLSIEESFVTNASNLISLEAVAVQSVYNSTAGNIIVPVQDDESLTNAQYKLANDTSAGFTSLSFASGINGHTVIVTYVKSSGLDITRFPYVPIATISLASEAIYFLGTTGYKGIVIPTLGTRIVGRDGVAGKHNPRLGGPSLTAANTKARWDPQLNKFTTAESTAMTQLRMPLLLQDPDFRHVSLSRELRVTEAPALTEVDVVVSGW